MRDYEPLDISPSCNAGPEFLDNDAADVNPRLKSFRGQPLMTGGVTDHIAYLNKPFLEAHAAVHERAHRLGFRL